MKDNTTDDDRNETEKPTQAKLFFAVDHVRAGVAARMDVLKESGTPTPPEAQEFYDDASQITFDTSIGELARKALTGVYVLLDLDWRCFGIRTPAQALRDAADREHADMG